MKKFLGSLILPVFFLFGTTLPAFAAYSAGPTNPYSFSVTPGTIPGSAVLHWYDDGGAYKYHIVYGTDPTNPSYGQLNVPFTPYTANTDTISFLSPGTTYYFSLLGYMKDNATPYYSGPIALQAPSTINQISTSSTTGLNSTNPYSLRATPGQQPGTITLNWYDDGGAYKYDLLYGTSPTNLTFGVPNIGFLPNSENSFTVGALNSHTTYYFLLRGYVKDMGNPYLSGPTTATAL